jgi:hypothetical protein
MQAAGRGRRAESESAERRCLRLNAAFDDKYAKLAKLKQLFGQRRDHAG